jgi:thiol-disulfide isomerase/thioredoxin
VLTAVIAMVLASGSGCGEDERAPRLKPWEPCASDYVAEVTVQQAAASVETAQGSVALVMFYSSGCSLSVAFFPEFLQVSDNFAEQGLEVFAFSTEECQKNLEEFLASYEIPFDPSVLVPWESGQLSAAFSGIGIQFTSPWTKPMVAVVGKDGAAAMQWEAASEYDVAEIESVIVAELGE